MTDFRSDRIARLARALSLTPTADTGVTRNYAPPQWWLMGCVEGDQPLPNTTSADSEEAAVRAAEEWLGVEEP